jgi:hypothetical protein
MRGHEPLIAMRKRGAVPHAVSITLDPISRDLTTSWPLTDWHGRVVALIAIEPADPIKRLDLRFLVGLPLVKLDGSDATRLWDLLDACKRVGVSRTVAILNRNGEAVEIRDTDKETAWHA